MSMHLKPGTLPGRIIAKENGIVCEELNDVLDVLLIEEQISKTHSIQLIKQNMTT